MIFKNVNPNKLHNEFISNNINCIVRNDLEEKQVIAENTWVTFEDGTDMELVQQIIDAHDPTPLPQPLSEIEQLRLEQAQANAELFEMMLMLTGGGF